jgi:uncharacterized LabA/DUF88 family protein
MRTIIYVDGFNLYFRLLHTRPHLKWLNIKALAQNVLGAQHRIIGVRYYTARVSGRTDPTAPARQQVYLDALGTIPEISVHLGSFLSSKKFAGLEEKGSDVNLASHLLLGAFRNEYDVAAIVSNDTDLVEPLRIVTNELGKVVTLLSPVPNPAPQLKAVAGFVRHIRVGHLSASQFADPLVLANGTLLSKPITWV